MRVLPRVCEVDAVDEDHAAVGNRWLAELGQFWSLLRALASNGRVLPPLILVTTGPGGDLVVLEGHARLTAFMLAGDRLLPELEALVGSSPAMTRWGLW